MKKYSQHTIDFLFPIALLFVFTASSLLVLLLASNIYQHIVRDSQSSFEQGTTLTYITNKLRQNDVRAKKKRLSIANSNVRSKVSTVSWS